MATDQDWKSFQEMPDLERMGLRRCAQYRMAHDPYFDEIGTSDVSHEAVSILATGDWPSEEERGEIGIGFLVEEFNNDLEICSIVAETHTPRETLERLQRDESWKHALPDKLYMGKHMLSQESMTFFEQARQMFGVGDS